uniref:C2 domain-containing protein n=2 Tax=Capitella teleta TaxID=283909 RepID=X1YW52_CAPTE
SFLPNPGAYSLGNIDPSLYKMNDEDDEYDIPEHHIGRIWFAVEYERESEKLQVTLMKAKNLPSRTLGQGNGCDPFVRIYLVPDDRRYLQSKFKKKTTNPKFEESFVFQVPNKAIDERVLKLTMYDIDRHKRHVVIGHALYPLREHNYESNERVVMWRDLEREVTEMNVERGEMNVSLSYNGHLERLTAVIIEGKAFKKVEPSSSDFYVKVCLMQQGKVVKSKRTDVAKRNVSPGFNESFTFKLPVASLDMASISLTAMQHVMGQRDKIVGRLVIGSFMFARGKELEHWNEMLANQKEQISQWHTLT